MKQRQTALLGCILVIVTGALYWPAVWFPFVVADDGLYVTANPWVTKGLNLAGMKWAFTSTYAANWHPLTWLSHQLDYSLWGTFAGGHHLTNIILHVFNTLLLFLLLKRLTGLLWPSFFVAALFGWHPLHVESVAWVAERKDVLSTFFFLLSVGAYAYYAGTKVQGPESKVQSMARGGLAYFLALLFFASGLMAKPMLVTLPFVLLLLDFWPLRRLHLGVGNTEEAGTLRVAVRRLLLEKLPFFGLAIASSAVTLTAQHAGGAMKSVEAVPVTLRLCNALAAYGHYLIGCFWPSNLCVFYPLSAKPPLFGGLVSAAALLVITGWSVRSRRKQPWAIVGWLWFLGTLVPVIGLVQVGGQARADRYTYIPFIGLFVMIAWTINSLLEHQHRSVTKPIAVSVAVLCCCLGWARFQLSFWRDSIALCSRAVAVTTDNAFAQNNLGMALAEAGKSDEATKHYAEALRIKPNYALARYNWGIQLASAGKLDDAQFQFDEALKQQPRSEILHNNIGVILAQQQKLDAAIEHFQRAIELNPNYPKPYLNFAMALQKKGEAGLALTNYNRALSLNPAWPEALDKVAFLLASCPTAEYHNPLAAVSLAEQANNMTHRAVADYLDTLAMAYAAAGQFSNAIPVAELARDQAARKGRKILLEELAQDLELYRTGRSPEVDWRSRRSNEIPLEWQQSGTASRSSARD